MPLKLELPLADSSQLFLNLVDRCMDRLLKTIHYDAGQNSIKMRKGPAWVGLYVHQRSVRERILLYADPVFRVLVILQHANFMLG